MRVDSVRVAPLLLLLVCTPVEAATYYISPFGSDSNDGTSTSTPWHDLYAVNIRTLKPGDRVLLLGGYTYADTLRLGPDDHGTDANPIEIGSYGPGRATIYPNDGTGILAYNVGGLRIHDLYIVGSGRTISTGHGMLIYTDLPGDVKLPRIEIDEIDAVRFGKAGITIGGNAGASGYRHVRITNVIANENGMAGVHVYAAAPYVHEDVYLSNVHASLNSGFSGLLYNSGNGIIVSGVNGATIEHSVAHDNGWLSNASNGPVGIWVFDVNNATLQFNESYNNKTGGTKDGGGFCFDQNTMNSVMQYNYSHGNAGAGYLLSHKPDNLNFTGNVVRYNVSDNDGRKNTYASFHVWGRIRNTEVYNNSFYITPASAPRAILIKNSSIPYSDVYKLHIRNNIIQTTGGVRAVEVTSDQLNGAVDLRFEGNLYYGTGYSSRFLWGSTTYYGLSAWRTATGQERLGGQPVGNETNPRLLKPGAMITIEQPGAIDRLESFRVDAASPAINTGIYLPTVFGINPGSRDYHGATIPLGSGYEVGAYEFDVACGWSVSPTTLSLPADDGEITLSVSTNDASCGWTAVSRVNWMTPIPPTTGMGSGAVRVAVGANSTTSNRTGTLLVGLRTVTVTQAGQPVQAPSPDNVVLYASESAVSLAGNWSLVSDASAAGGRRVQQANAGAAKILAPLASPANYFEATFNAVAGKPYRLWLRGKAISNFYGNDSVYVQFDQSVDTSGAATARIGTTSGYTVNLEDCGGCGLSGWGWQDDGWGVGVMGPTVQFATTGLQRMRIQQREDGLGIDQIILSPSTWLSSAPGALKNDTTIVPKP